MFQRDARRLIAAAGAAAFLCGPARAALPCAADLDGDGAVGIVDFLQLLSAWGQGGPADINGDGIVTVTDLLGLLSSWGPVAFDFGPPLPDAEAQQVGLEMLGSAGPLLVPPDIYQRIHLDISAIRHNTAALVGQGHSPAWVPDQLLVSVPGAQQDEYLCLNEVYQVINIEVISPRLHLYLLTFTGKINVEALTAIYEQAPEVQYAEPNGIIGGENFWVPTPLGGNVWQWDVDDGFWDCFDGCDCHRLYVFQTDGQGNVQLISYQEVGAPWCVF